MADLDAMPDPRGVGEILDAGIALYRRELVTLWRATLPLGLAAAAIGGAAAVALMAYHPRETIGGFVVRDSSFDLSALGRDVLFIVVLLAGYVALVGLTALTHVAIARNIGAPPEYARALRFGLRKSGHLLVLLVLFQLGTGFASYLFVIPGIILRARWSIATIVLAAEDTSGVHALGRSMALTGRRTWVTIRVQLALSLFLGTVISLFAVLAVFAIKLLPTLYAGTTGAFVGFAVVELAAPIAVAVLLSLYIDSRVRHEGLDIQMMAAALPEPGPPAMIRP